jgi:hypothetical protein
LRRKEKKEKHRGKMGNITVEKEKIKGKIHEREKKKNGKSKTCKREEEGKS